MIKLDRLNVYLTDRLAAAVREILEVVENTVSDYIEETNRTRSENESLKQRLRDVLKDADSFDPAIPVSVPDPESPGVLREWNNWRDECSLSQQGRSQSLDASSLKLYKGFSATPHTVDLDVDLKFNEAGFSSHVQTKSEMTADFVIRGESGLFPTPDPGEGTASSEGSSNFNQHSESFSNIEGKGEPTENEDTTSPPGGNLNAQVSGDSQTLRLHQCGQCGKSFSQRKNLRSHQIMHRKLRGCHVCGKAFAQSGDLKRHLLTHSGERPHQCQLCPRSFAQMGNLRRHIKKQHPCLPCPDSRGQMRAVWQHQPTHVRERPLCCIICQQGFPTAKGLQLHLRKAHHKARNRTVHLSM